MSDYVLVVEDDQNLAVTIAMVLEAEGYTSHIARNGLEALEAVAARMPELIILDMLMPVMDGWEFARQFRARYGRPAPILVFTAAEDPIARGLDIDASSVLAKPFDVNQLLATVKRLIAQRGSEQAAPA
jgi:DNA-binding response OmpR family regulator